MSASRHIGLIFLSGLYGGVSAASPPACSAAPCGTGGEGGAICGLC